MFLWDDSASLGKRVNNDEVIGLLELDDGLPQLVRREFLLTLLHEAAVQPEVESELVQVELNADHSWSGGPESLSHLILLVRLIRYSDLYII